jgi:hypothetical protein
MSANPWLMGLRSRAPKRPPGGGAMGEETDARRKNRHPHPPHDRFLELTGTGVAAGPGWLLDGRMPRADSAEAAGEADRGAR